MDNPLMRGPALAKPWGVLLTGFFAIVTLIPSSSLHADNLPAGFTESQIGGLGANMASPTAMAFAPDGRLFVCTQGGSLYVIKNGVLLGTSFLTVPVDASGERGLLGVAIPADFAVNSFIYICNGATAARCGVWPSSGIRATSMATADPTLFGGILHPATSTSGS